MEWSRRPGAPGSRRYYDGVAPAGGEGLEVRRYLEILRRQRLLISLVTVGLVAAVVALSLLQTRVYRASAEILIEPRATEAVFSSDQQANPATATVETEVRVLRSDPVRQAVKKMIGYVPAVTAGRVGETEVLQVNGTRRSAASAAAVANAYAQAYVEYRKSQAVGDLASASKSIRDKVDALQSEIDDLDRRLAATSAAGLPALQASIGPRYQNLLTEQGLLAQKLDALEVDATLKSGGAQLVRSATVPSSPASPKPLRNAVIACLVGLIMGTGLGFLREYLDDSLKTKDDLVTALPDVPVLAIVPVFEEGEFDGIDRRLRALREGATPVAEVYRNLRTSVQLLGIEHPLRTIQVTSASPGEGKTTLVANLGIVLAALGQRVVMVDCDLRRPMLHQVFEIANDHGFTSVFQGGQVIDAVSKVAGEDRLFVLPSGPVPPNPSELLGAKRTAAILFELQSNFDVVLVDSAPVLPVTDAVVLAGWVEATLLVVTAGSTTSRMATEAAEQLRRVEAPLAGTVLNRAQRDATYGYGYGYGQRPAMERLTRGARVVHTWSMSEGDSG